MKKQVIDVKIINSIALYMASVGALNWLFKGFADFDLVEKITSALNLPFLATIIYGLVGIAGGWIGIHALMGNVKINN